MQHVFSFRGHVRGGKKERRKGGKMAKRKERKREKEEEERRGEKKKVREVKREGTVGLPLHAGGTPAPPSSSLFACGGLLLKPSTTTHSHKKHSPHGHVHFCSRRFVHVPPSQRRPHACRHPPLPCHMSPYVPWVPVVVAGSPSMIYTEVCSDIHRPTVPVIWTPFLAVAPPQRMGRWQRQRGSRSCVRARRGRCFAPCWEASHGLFVPIKGQREKGGTGVGRILATGIEPATPGLGNRRSIL